jgi:hypothetical protein
MTMRLELMVAGALLLGFMGVAQASECGEQVRVLDDRYGLALGDAGALPRDPHEQAAEQIASSGSGGAPSSSAGIDTVPNTGGLATPRNMPVEPLDAVQRQHVREALLAARHANEIGDGTTCAAKLTEARRLAGGGVAPAR